MKATLLTYCHRGMILHRLRVLSETALLKKLGNLGANNVLKKYREGDSGEEWKIFCEKCAY